MFGSAYAYYKKKKEKKHPSHFFDYRRRFSLVPFFSLILIVEGVPREFYVHSLLLTFSNTNSIPVNS